MKYLLAITLLFYGAEVFSEPSTIYINQFKQALKIESDFFYVPALFVFDSNGQLIQALQQKDIRIKTSASDHDTNHQYATLEELTNKIPQLQLLKTGELAYILVDASYCAPCKPIITEFKQETLPTLPNNKNITTINLELD